MSYLTYLDIKYFKGIEDLELNELSNINIIVGSNNIGKTSILESISLLQSEDSIKTMLKHVLRRESIYPSKLQLFLEIFPKKYELSKHIQVNSTINGLSRELKISGGFLENEFKGTLDVRLNNKNIINKEIIFKENEFTDDKIIYDIIKIIYITPYDHFKDGLINTTIEQIKESEKTKIIKLLQMFDSSILDFKVLAIDVKNNLMTTHISHKKYGDMPLFAFGDSIKKILTLASAVISAKGGILLIDEIETAIHKNMVVEVFKWLIELCIEYKVQLICTTHSLEVIDSMIIASQSNINDLCCFRIENYDDKIYGTRFSGNKLKDIRTFLGQDVR